ncbi:MAG: hypothetical protein E4H46_00075 [Desulfobacterales bacterium]|nr:MAG: hypothetical protein E4H46_00075 [Desulfobacterales bacterium]
MSAANLQARLLVVFQQQDDVISRVTDGQMITAGKMTFVLANDEIAAKAAALQGHRVHVLFYETAQERYCAELRPIGEQAFDLSTLQERENGHREKQNY